MISKRRVMLVILMLAAAQLIISPIIFAQETNQDKCPVRGSTINKNVYVDYEGKRIYFCCPPCIKSFLNNPERYLKQMEKEGIILENAPKAKSK